MYVPMGADVIRELRAVRGALGERLRGVCGPGPHRLQPRLAHCGAFGG